jgi:LuxR family maltose regulon positive regulatory protein
MTGVAGGKYSELLTKRENEILQYLPTLMSYDEIAKEMYISRNTVKSHLKFLYLKLGAHNRHEAVEQAKKMNLL